MEFTVAKGIRQRDVGNMALIEMISPVHCGIELGYALIAIVSESPWKRERVCSILIDRAEK